MNSKKEPTKPEENKTNKRNDIRISINSITRNVIRYCNGLLKEKSCKFLHFSAVGGSIGKLVSVIEVLKVVNPGLYQYNKFATVSYVPKEKDDPADHRLFPKMEVVLSLEDIKDKNDSFRQNKLDENERQKLFNLLNEKIQNKRFRRGGFRGRRGGFRGRRGTFRGRRGTFRGRRGATTFRYRRGGFRGNNRGSRGRATRGFRGGRGVRRGNRNNN